MRFSLLAALSLVMLVSACGTRLNPFNWFGGAEASPPADTQQLPSKADPRLLALQITELKVEPMPGGAIVRATAVMESQGWWQAELVALEDEPVDGAMVYEFRVFPPQRQTRVSTPQSRQVTAAVFLSDIRLSTIRSITVQGQTNGLTSRR
ncbi:hypothetical protein [Gemmobacter aquaticus]|nr:hypothetical protein [Gemmobacter aquaticus]